MTADCTAIPKDAPPPPPGRRRIYVNQACAQGFKHPEPGRKKDSADAACKTPLILYFRFKS